MCVCVCVFFFFLVGKVRDTARKLNRGRGSISIGAALTLTLRTTKEHQKNGQLRKHLVPILESEKTLGTRLATQVATQTDRVALARPGEAQCERRN